MTKPVSILIIIIAIMCHNIWVSHVLNISAHERPRSSHHLAIDRAHKIIILAQSMFILRIKRRRRGDLTLPTWPCNLPTLYFHVAFLSKNLPCLEKGAKNLCFFNMWPHHSVFLNHILQRKKRIWMLKMSFFCS